MGAYRKIPKIRPGAYIFQRSFWRGLSKEGNLRFNDEGYEIVPLHAKGRFWGYKPI